MTDNDNAARLAANRAFDRRWPMKVATRQRLTPTSRSEATHRSAALTREAVEGGAA